MKCAARQRFAPMAKTDLKVIAASAVPACGWVWASAAVHPTMGLRSAKWPLIFSGAVQLGTGLILAVAARRERPLFRIGQNAKTFFCAENALNVVMTIMAAISLSGFWTVGYAVISGKSGLDVGLLIVDCGIFGATSALFGQDFGHVWERIADSQPDGNETGQTFPVWRVRPRPRKNYFSRVSILGYQGYGDADPFAHFERLTVFLAGIFPPTVFTFICLMMIRPLAGHGLRLHRADQIYLLFACAAVSWIRLALRCKSGNIVGKPYGFALPLAILATLASTVYLIHPAIDLPIGFASLAVTFIASEMWLFQMFLAYSAKCLSGFAVQDKR